MPIKTSISFGMVHIPVSLHTAVKSNDIGFNMLHKKYNSRISYKRTCPECKDEVKPDDIVKGYQYAKGQYVVLTDEDLEKIKTPKDKTIKIEQFVNLNEINPVLYDKAYYLKPEGADRAFCLLKEAMKSENKVGIAKAVFSNKETLIAVRVDDNQLFLSTLFFDEEIQKGPSQNLNIELSDKEINLAKTIIENMSEKFDAEKFKDEYKERLMDAISSKINGKEIVAPKEVKDNKIINLMEALQESLKQAEEKAKTKKKETKTQTQAQKTKKTKKAV